MMIVTTGKRNIPFSNEWIRLAVFARRWRLLAALLIAVSASAPRAAAEGRLTTDAGIDWRYYDVVFDNPVTYQANRSSQNATDTQRGTYYQYFRLRTRPWGLLTLDERYDLYARLGHEFRVYDNNKQNYRFPDELFIDSLYVEFRELLNDRLSLRVGRQDMRYGAGRMIRDGTPGDVTRSYFFDAIKGQIKVDETSTLDLIGIWQRPVDHWTLGNERVDLTRYASRKGGNDLTERALAAYYSNRAQQEFPYDLYYIYKDESRWFAGNSGTRIPERRYHTLGARIVPRLTEHWSAEAEVAGQIGTIGSSATVGERDILAWLAYGGATYRRNEWRWKPYVTTAVLVMSGDDERFDDPNARGTDTGWNPIFARSIWSSDILTAGYACYRVSNWVYPHAEAGITPVDDHTFNLQAGPNYAYTSDNANDDTYRGFLVIGRYLFNVLKDSKTWRGPVRGAFKAEMLRAGDYYGAAEAAYYLRFELYFNL
jgi:hypothetical protein